MALGDLLNLNPTRELNEAELAADPFVQFRRCLDEAIAAGLPQPDAMTLATATAAGIPSARMVLLRGYDERGFAFYTNYESRKGEELTANPRAALVFYWAPLERQIRIEGTVTTVTEAESDAYFQSRPRGSCLSAIASPQSRVVPNREVLEEKVRQLEEKFLGQTVPRPATWGGYRVVPAQIEFWQGRANRLHDRLRYVREEGGMWRIERLSP